MLPAEWVKFGARFGRDGLLYLAEWRRGFTVHELRALFFECQQARALQAEIRTLRRDLDAAESRALHAERRAAFYRRQCVSEARMGLALSRILG